MVWSHSQNKWKVSQYSHCPLCHLLLHPLIQGNLSTANYIAYGFFPDPLTTRYHLKRFIWWLKVSISLPRWVVTKSYVLHFIHILFSSSALQTLPSAYNIYTTRHSLAGHRIGVTLVSCSPAGEENFCSPIVVVVS